MDKRYKIDLHTHSVISGDGGITREQYGLILKKGELDCVAITDHNETKFALEMAEKWGDKIIVGEEIMTLEGEMIGLFLQKTVAKNLTAKHTAKLIHEQGGLVYIPHPFETLRRGLQINVLQTIINDTDIVEVFNARSKWRGKSEEALKFAKKNDKAMASSSDSHCRMGIASAFSIISEMPTRKTLVNLLKNGALQKKYAPLISYLCPTVNRIARILVNYVPSPFRRRTG